jgi:hypothetical protein
MKFLGQEIIYPNTQVAKRKELLRRNGGYVVRNGKVIDSTKEREK